MMVLYREFHKIENKSYTYLHFIVQFSVQTTKWEHLWVHPLHLLPCAQLVALLEVPNPAVVATPDPETRGLLPRNQPDRYFVQFVGIMRRVNIMESELAKAAKDFSKEQYRKMPNMFV